MKALYISILMRWLSTILFGILSLVSELHQSVLFAYRKICKGKTSCEGSFRIQKHLAVKSCLESVQSSPENFASLNSEVQVLIDTTEPSHCKRSQGS
jgi:hypothetical protein